MQPKCNIPISSSPLRRKPRKDLLLFYLSFQDSSWLVYNRIAAQKTKAAAQKASAQTKVVAEKASAQTKVFTEKVTSKARNFKGKFVWSFLLLLATEISPY